YVYDNPPCRASLSVNIYLRSTPNVTGNARLWSTDSSIGIPLNTFTPDSFTEERRIPLKVLGFTPPLYGLPIPVSASR
ncbi:hypothetical protein QE152_g41362, partial [Popillia japonica]